MKYYVKIIILIIILVFIALTIYLLYKREPINVLESKMNIKLPVNSKIINYRYNIDGGYFNVKIRFDEGDFKNIRNQLLLFFGKKSNRSINEIPNFKKVCNWWDLNINNIVEYYSLATSGKSLLFESSPKTYNVWAFICKDEDGKYNLYISY